MALDFLQTSFEAVLSPSSRPVFKIPRGSIINFDDRMEFTGTEFHPVIAAPAPDSCGVLNQ